MKFINTPLNIRLLLLGFLYAFIIFFYPFTFNYQIDIQKSYFLLPFCCLSYIISAASKKGGRFSILQQSLYFSTFIFLTFTPFFSNEHLTFLLSILITLGLLLNSEIRSIEQVLLIVFFFYGLELCIGLFQFWEQRNYSVFYIKGSLNNSGIFSIYLVIHIPLAWYFLRKIKANGIKIWVKLLFVIVLFLCSLFIYVNQARTAAIAFCIVFFALLFPVLKAKYRFLLEHRLARSLLVIFGIVILTLSIFLVKYLLQIKPGSTNGRLLMLAVTYEHLFDYFWWGFGFGRFSFYYPQWQQFFFLNHGNSVNNYFLNSGESYFVFNEYLILFKEIGIFGCVFSTALLVCFFRSNAKFANDLLHMLKLVVLAILVCGITSYPLHVGPILFLLILCIFSVFALRDTNFYFPFLKLKSWIQYLNIGLAIWLVVTISTKTIAAFQWLSIRNNLTLSQNKKVTLYRELLPSLKDDGKFLTDYGELLLCDSSYYKEASFYLEASKRIFISYHSIQTLAMSYKYQNDYNSAIKNYMFLAYYVPSRFMPKYEIAKLYLKYGDTSTAKIICSQILKMPIKIPSIAVFEIRAEAIRIINL